MSRSRNQSANRPDISRTVPSCQKRTEIRAAFGESPTTKKRVVPSSSAYAPVSTELKRRSMASVPRLGLSLAGSAKNAAKSSSITLGREDQNTIVASPTDSFCRESFPNSVFSAVVYSNAAFLPIGEFSPCFFPNDRSEERRVGKE